MKRGIALDYFDDDIDQGPADRRERLAVNDNAFTDAEYRRVMDVPFEAYPSRLSKDELHSRGEVAGYVDACLGRPLSIAVRFCEEQLQYLNMENFRVFANAYEAAFNRKARSA